MSAIINPLSGFNNVRFRTAVGPLRAAGEAKYPGYTVVGKYKPGVLKAAGGSIRLTIQGYLGGGRVGAISAVYIGLASSAAGANAYDFAATPTQITFAGSGSVSLTTGAVRTSDEIDFTIDASKAVLIAYDVAASPIANFVSLTTGLGTNYAMYVRSGLQASTPSKSQNYTVRNGTSPFLQRLECAS